MARLNYISGIGRERAGRYEPPGLGFDNGQRIAFDGEVLVEADGKAPAVTAAAKSIDPRMGDVYLHPNASGGMDVRIQNDGKKPPEKWWEPQEDAV